MEYISYENITTRLSRMIYGTGNKIMTDGDGADEMLDCVIEQGITTFDTARSYGNSERNLGNWIAKRGNRNSINILTKGCNPHMTGVPVSAETLREELMTSLNELQTEYVDFYTLHRDDTNVDVAVYIETLNAFVEEGKVRSFGASNWDYRRMEEANTYASEHGLKGFTFGSPAFSLAEVVGDPWGGSIHLSGDDNADAREWFAKKQIPVFAYSSFARGFFSGKYRTDMKQEVTDVLPPWTCKEYVCPENLERLKRAEILAAEKGVTVSQINLAWILAQPFVCCPILGPSTEGHLLENLKGMELKLTEQEILWLNLK